VFELREELGKNQGTVGRIVNWLGYGTESLCRWVAQVVGRPVSAEALQRDGDAGH
jgi:hypothetical protein